MTGTVLLHLGLHVPYAELVPNTRIRHSDRFDDPAMRGEMTITISLNSAQAPIEFYYLGRRESLTLLALVVEPEILDGA